MTGLASYLGVVVGQRYLGAVRHHLLSVCSCQDLIIVLVAVPVLGDLAVELPQLLPLDVAVTGGVPAGPGSGPHVYLLLYIRLTAIKLCPAAFNKTVLGQTLVNLIPKRLIIFGDVSGLFLCIDTDPSYMFCRRVKIRVRISNIFRSFEVS